MCRTIGPTDHFVWRLSSADPDIPEAAIGLLPLFNPKIILTSRATAYTAGIVAANTGPLFAVALDCRSRYTHLVDGVLGDVGSNWDKLLANPCIHASFSPNPSKHWSKRISRRPLGRFSWRIRSPALGACLPGGCGIGWMREGKQVMRAQPVAPSYPSPGILLSLLTAKAFSGGKLCSLHHSAIS